MRHAIWMKSKYYKARWLSACISHVALGLYILIPLFRNDRPATIVNQIIKTKIHRPTCLLMKQNILTWNTMWIPSGTYKSSPGPSPGAKPCNMLDGLFSPSKNPPGIHMEPLCVGTCGFWMGMPNLAGIHLCLLVTRYNYVWNLSTKNPHGVHMRLIWIVGSRWEGPSGIHLVCTWATRALVNPDKTQMGPRYFSIWEYSSPHKTAVWSLSY